MSRVRIGRSNGPRRSTHGPLAKAHKYAHSTASVVLPRTPGRGPSLAIPAREPRGNSGPRGEPRHRQRSRRDMSEDLAARVSAICREYGSDAGRMMDITRTVQAEFGCVSEQAVERYRRRDERDAGRRGELCFLLFLPVERAEGKGRHPGVRRRPRSHGGFSEGPRRLLG